MGAAVAAAALLPLLPLLLEDEKRTGAGRVGAAVAAAVAALLGGSAGPLEAAGAGVGFAAAGAGAGAVAVGLVALPPPPVDLSCTARNGATGSGARAFDPAPLLGAAARGALCLSLA